MRSGRSSVEWTTRRLPIVLRTLAVTITVVPAVAKFLAYSSQVDAFASYGVPWPAVAVPLVGVVELLAVVSLSFGIAGRLGAGALVVTMLVAVVAAGPSPFNVVVLLASVGVCLLGTGPYSCWNASVTDLSGLPARAAGIQGGPRREVRD